MTGLGAQRNQQRFGREGGQSTAALETYGGAGPQCVCMFAFLIGKVAFACSRMTRFVLQALYPQPPDVAGNLQTERSCTRNECYI